MTPAQEAPATTTDGEHTPGATPRRPSGRRGVAVVGVAAALAVLLAALVRDVVRRAAPWDVSATLDGWRATLVPAVAGYAVPPHPAVLVTLVTVGTGLLAALAALVAVRVARGRAARALVLWVGLVLAAVCVVGAFEVGQVVLEIERFGGRGGAHVRMFTLPALGAAVRWGVLWGGLVTALTVRLLPERAPRAGRAAGVLGALALVTLVLLAGASRAASISPATEVAQPPEAVATPTDPPAVRASVAPPATVDPGSCAQESLTMAIGGFDAASGRRAAAVTATNDTALPCTLTGRPDLAFADADGDAVRPELVEGPGWSGEGAEVVPLTLAPGQSATADLQWRGDAPGGVFDVQEVWLAPWAGALRTVLPEPMDLRDGTELTVSAWYAAPEQG